MARPFFWENIQYVNRFIDFVASRPKLCPNTEEKESQPALKDDENGSGSFGEHPQKGFEGLNRFLKTDKRFDLKEIKSGIGSGVKLYPKPFMDSSDEVVS
jgi:hypothetical protein